jgi:Tfp pilus assembly protein FimT
VSSRVPSRRRATTLVELLVTLAVIGIATGVAALAAPRLDAPVDDPPARIARARATAIDSARAVTITVAIDGRLVDVTAHPDGSIIADSGTGVLRFTGRAPHGSARRSR